MYKIICAFSLSDKKLSKIKRKGGITDAQKIKERTGCTPRSITDIQKITSFKQLKMDGYEKHNDENKDTENRRNGHSQKTVCSEFGDVTL